MAQNNKKGEMRLNREAKMAKSDYDKQIKKTGTINDGFICLPDPENVYEWYYLIYNLDYNDYRGGFYMGKIKCPPEYPSKAPKIILLHENGRFHTWDNGICLSISDYHPESWNPVWKVNQVVIGLVSFWQTKEDTYGGVYTHEMDRKLRKGETRSDYIINLAKKSRQQVLDHPKFHIFEKYADIIGIKNEPEIKGWKEHGEKIAKLEVEWAEQKRIEDEKRQKADEERKKKEEERKQKEEEQKRIETLKANQQAQKEYFRKIHQMGLTQFVGNKKRLGQIQQMKKAYAA